MIVKADGPFAALCRIYLAELLEGNRQEIVKYLCNDEDAWNWEPYYEFQVCWFIFIIELNHFHVSPRPLWRQKKISAQ